MKQTNNTNKPSVTFNDCKNVGEQIDALVRKFTSEDLIGKYILERALEDVKKNNLKLDEFKKKLLK